MTLSQFLTELVAGRGTMERSSQRAFERRHARRGTESALSDVVSTAPESTPVWEIASRSGSVSSRSSADVCESLSPSPSRPLHCRSKLRRDLEQLQAGARIDDHHPESQHNGQLRDSAINTQSCAEPLVRKHSTERRLWHDSFQQSPLVSTCVGYGRWSISPSASIEAKVSLIKQNMFYMEPDMVNDILNSGVLDHEPEAVRIFLKEWVPRCDNITGIVINKSPPSPVSYEETVDATTGTRICRGFSTTSTSSFRKLRESSLVGVGRRSVDPVYLTKSAIVGSLKSSLMDPSGTRPSYRAVSAGPELRRAIVHEIRKITRPCHFSEDSNENAIASDSEDDNDICDDGGGDDHKHEKDVGDDDGWEDFMACVGLPTDLAEHNNLCVESAPPQSLVSPRIST